MSTFIQLLYASKRCSGVQGQSKGIRKAKPPEAKTLLAFGRATKAANFLAS